MTPPSDAPPELLQTTALRDAFAEDLLAALQSPSRRVPSKYLYDEQGSKLFEQICEQPEYYLTRAERAILHEHGAEIAGQIGPGCVLIELGSGSSRKTQLLLDKLEAPLAYVPVDISPAALLEASG